MIETLVLVLLSVAAASVLTAAMTLRATRRALQRLQESNVEAREEERSAFLGTIATGLAHELRNPLSTLRMHLQLLEEEWARPVTEREERSHKRLAGLLREVARLEAILEGFLKFATEHPVQAEDVAVLPFLRDLADFMRPRFEAKGVELEVKGDEARATFDPNLMRQAVMNLLLNALDATPSGGTVRLDGDERTLRVADSGEGVATDLRERIFHLYFSTKPSGTGLGLPYARKVVEQHGGTIAVEDRPGGGSIFTIRLPGADV